MKIIYMFILIFFIPISSGADIVFNNDSGWQSTSYYNSTLSGKDVNYTVVGISANYFDTSDSTVVNENFLEVGSGAEIQNKKLNLTSSSAGVIDQYIPISLNNYSAIFSYSITGGRFGFKFYVQSYSSWANCYEIVFRESGGAMYYFKDGTYVATIDDFTLSIEGIYRIVIENNETNTTVCIYDTYNVEQLNYIVPDVEYKNGTVALRAAIGSSLIDNYTIRYGAVNQGNVTHYHDAGSGYQGSQFKFIFNNDSNSFLEGWVSADNSTWYQVTDNVTNDTLMNIPAAYKNQTQYIRAVLKGNSTSTPEEIEAVITTEASGISPSITTYAPTTPTTSYENVDKSFNITVNQTVNVTWYLNGSLKQTNTSVTTATYTNTTAANGTWNVTAIATNVNGSDSQIWDWNVLLNSVDITYRELNYSNLTANVLIDISNKTAGLQTINLSHIGNLSSEYCLCYPNSTSVQACITATSEGETILFDGSADRLPELNGYPINETEGAATSTIIIPVNSYGMINNWTAATNFSNIAANESNDVCYTYYNVTTGEWDSYYVGYSWNANYVIPLEASVFMFVDAETTVTATIVTPSSTELYTGWNMIFVEGTDNETISSIIADIGANCSDVWKFNSTAGTYSNTVTDTVQPNQGFLAYITQDMTWTRSDL